MLTLPGKSATSGVNPYRPLTPGNLAPLTTATNAPARVTDIVINEIMYKPPDTQGKGEFTMEFNQYQAVPRNVQEEMVKKYQEKRAKENK